MHPGTPTRRELLLLALAPAATACWSLGLQAQRRYRVLLNSGFSGPQAFFFVAQDRGDLKSEGLDLEFVGGDGAAAVVSRIGAEGFDFGYGDLTALVPLVAARRPDAPIAVYVAFNTTPLTIAVRADGPIRTPRDLEGKRLIGHPIDAALEAFPEFCLAAGVDATRVEIVRSSASMRMLAEDVLAGKADGLFGFVNTIVAALAPGGIDGRARLRFLEYRHHTPDLYGNALMVSRRLLAEHRREVSAIVRAINRGLATTIGDLDAAIASVARRNPSLAVTAERARLAGTLASEFAHPEGKRLGIGDVDDERLARAIALTAKARKLARVPAVGEIFTRECLPPASERIRTLAR